jgi:hypothetical protein
MCEEISEVNIRPAGKLRSVYQYTVAGRKNALGNTALTYILSSETLYKI